MSLVNASHGTWHTVDRAILHPLLQQGYSDVRFNRPFDYLACERGHSYERGRQLAIEVRRILNTIPPLPRGIELVRPIYIALRLSQTITGEHRLSAFADPATGLFSPARYAERQLGISTADVSHASSLDNLFL